MQRRVVLGLTLILALVLTPAILADDTLANYVNRPDDSYTFEVVSSESDGAMTAHVVRMTSQTWQGIAWRHWLTIYEPSDLSQPGHAMLLISGGNSNSTQPRLDNGEARIIAQIARSTGTLTAVLEQVPNQPLFNGLSEDGIISLTFERFLKGEGDDWPLLLPMVKSAVRAMDTIEAISLESIGKPTEKFFMLGGSKRGWTTWLSSVVDDRIFGIAPCVIDTLNMGAQSELQLKSYGEFSSQIDDYTNRGIQDWFDTPQGRRLNQIVDPYAYCSQLTLPKLVVLGTNDPYWTVDSSSLYFPYLVGEKHLYYGPNIGHDVEVNGVKTIVEFYQRLINGTPRPTYEWSHAPDGSLVVTWDTPEAHARLWQATAPGRDFRGSRWTSTDLTGDGRVEVKLDAPNAGYRAFYVELLHPAMKAGDFGLCTTMTVIPETFPFENIGAPATE